MQRMGFYALVSSALLSACGGDSSTNPPETVCATPMVENDSIEPLQPQQWYLHNTGQNAYAQSGGTPGVDLNVLPVYQQGITGKGVHVMIADQSVEDTHPDLCGNFLRQGSLNFLCLDPKQQCSVNSPMQGLPLGNRNLANHGTSSAGIIAASRNEQGVLGIAYQSQLLNVNTLLGQNIYPFLDVYAFAFGKQEGLSFPIPLSARYAINHADIVNFSLGGVAGFNQFNDDAQAIRRHYFFADVIDTYSLDYRQGKGLIYVKSAGNNYRMVNNDPNVNCAVQGSLQDPNATPRDPFYRPDYYGLSCASTNLDNMEQGMSPMVVVAALNAQGKRSSYSSTGSAILVSGLGGEYGDADPAMVTTDVRSCQYGYSTDPLAIPGDPHCDYTHRFNGTSSAAPTISGVIALMLEANPDLSDRDVREILIRSARQVDTGATRRVMKLNKTGPEVTLQYVWVTNAAGYTYNNQYGYGLPDAAKAVALAKTWSTQDRAFEKAAGSQVWQNTLDVSTQVVRDTHSPLYQPIARYQFELTPDNLAYQSGGAITALEMVRFTGSIESYRSTDAGAHFQQIETQPAKVLLTLISPSGTPSVINEPLGHADIRGFNMARIISNAFYGEPLWGTWTIELATVADTTDHEFDGQVVLKQRLSQFYLDFLGN